MNKFYDILNTYKNITNISYISPNDFTMIITTINKQTKYNFINVGPDTCVYNSYSSKIHNNSQSKYIEIYTTFKPTYTVIKKKYLKKNNQIYYYVKNNKVITFIKFTDLNINNGSFYYEYKYYKYKYYIYIAFYALYNSYSYMKVKHSLNKRMYVLFW